MKKGSNGAVSAPGQWHRGASDRLRASPVSLGPVSPSPVALSPVTLDGVPMRGAAARPTPRNPTGSHQTGLHPTGLHQTGPHPTGTPPNLGRLPRSGSRNARRPDADDGERFGPNDLGPDDLGSDDLGRAPVIPPFQQRLTQAAPGAFLGATSLGATSAAMPQLDELIDILRRRFAWVLVTMAITVAVGLSLAVTAEKRYYSKAELLLNPNALRIVDNDLLQASGTAELQNMQLESELHVLRSLAVIEGVVDRLDLTAHREFEPSAPGLKSALSGFFGGTNGVVDRRRLVTDRVADAVTIQRQSRSFVVEVGVETSDPSLSADIANMLVEVYLERRLNVRSDEAERVSLDLQGRIGALRADLLASERAVEDFKAENNLSASGGHLLSQQQLQATNLELSNARARSANARAVLEQIERAQSSGNLDSVLEAVRSRAVSQLRTQQGALKSQYAERAATLGPKHPQLISLKGQIAEVDALVAAELGRIAEAARSDLELAEATESLLAAEVSALERSSFDTNETLLRLRELEREAQSRRSVYESFLARSQQLQGQKNLDTTEARVIMDAVPALEPQAPAKALVLAGALLFGAGLGAGLAVMRDLLDPYYGTAMNLARAARLPIVADLTGAHRSAQAADEARTGLAKLLSQLRSRSPQEGPSLVLLLSPGPSEVRTHCVLELMEVAMDGRLATLVVDGDPVKRLLSASAKDAGSMGFAEAVQHYGHHRLKRRLGSLVDTSGQRPWILPLKPETAVSLAACDGASIALALGHVGRETDFIFIDGGVPQSPRALPALMDAADHILVLADPATTQAPQLAALLHALSPNFAKCRGLVTHDQHVLS